ncbi:MAG: glycosyltransferase family 2 protein [Deltaproteobacteria bacterium]|nr:glycosyltransferase family 2 protein [Deltaproteobacteria bacterium]
MWLISTAAYWSSLAVVGYTYAGYPAAITALGKLRRRPVAGDPGYEPGLAIVMAAHNEAARIGAKLDNLLALDYPATRRQIVVVSDGSTDGTDDVVRGYADRGVELIRVERASGKPSALNLGVAAVRPDAEVIVFCDARQRIDAGALRALVAPLADPDVGAVSGELFMEGEAGPGLYWRYEKLIRAAESQVDSVVGATGALYAIRRALYRQLPPETLLDDVFTPMQIAMQGFRVLFEPAAKVYDQEASVQGEFARKARTLAGNYQLLRQLPALLDPRKNRLLPQLLSHKLMRLACPFALGTLLASNVYLVATFAPGWPLYAATLAGQLAGYGLALSGALRGERAGKLARTSWTFVALNAAAVEGLRRYLKGDFAWTSGR